MKIRLWLDDVRPAPEGWIWARTNKEAIILLENYEVEEASLDHDLGLEGLDPSDPDTIYGRGNSPDGSGFDLVTWMIENKKVPAKVSIHSWSQAGARRMAGALNEAGYDCFVSPFNL